MGNALEQLRKETRDDARLYGCIRELYEQGVPFEELKAVIPDIRRTREQLHMKRMLENNNEVLMQMFSREMSFLLDAKERQEEEQFKKIDQLIRQQQSYRTAAADAGPNGYSCLLKFANFVYSPSQARLTVPTGPFLCFAIIISACFLNSESLL